MGRGWGGEESGGWGGDQRDSGWGGGGGGEESKCQALVYDILPPELRCRKVMLDPTGEGGMGTNSKHWFTTSFNHCRI